MFQSSPVRIWTTHNSPISCKHATLGPLHTVPTVLCTWTPSSHLSIMWPMNPNVNLSVELAPLAAFRRWGHRLFQASSLAHFNFACNFIEDKNWWLKLRLWTWWFVDLMEQSCILLGTWPTWQSTAKQNAAFLPWIYKSSCARSEPWSPHGNLS